MIIGVSSKDRYVSAEGRCAVCGDDSGIIVDRGGVGYAEGFHSRD